MIYKWHHSRKIIGSALADKYVELAGTAWKLTHDAIDTRSDIYSLGVLLYELLTGHTPIDRETLTSAGLDEVRRVIRDVDPLRPSLRIKSMPAAELTTAAGRRHIEPRKLRSLLHGDLDWIVMKCLEKDWRRRYETPNGLALDLQCYLRSEMVTARPPTTSTVSMRRSCT